MITWDLFYTYLLQVKHRKIDSTKPRERQNYWVENSRFNTVYAYFVDKPFNRYTCDAFLATLSDKSNSTKNNHLKIIKNICGALRYYEMEIDEVLKKIETIPYWEKTRLKRIEVLTPQEIKAIAEIKIPYPRKQLQTNKRYRAIIYTLALGLRIQEARNLTYNDFKFDELNGYYFVIETGKTVKAHRKIYIPARLARQIVKLQRFDHNYIFGSYQGPMDCKRVNKEIKLRIEILGIQKKITAHTFRHSFINHALRKGMPLAVVMEHVGHTNPVVTLQYAHLTIEDTKVLVEAYEVFKRGFIDKVKEELIYKIQNTHDKNILKSINNILPFTQQNNRMW